MRSLARLWAPGLWLRKDDSMACLCAVSWMCSRMFPRHRRLNKAQFSKPSPSPSSLSLHFPVSVRRFTWPAVTHNRNVGDNLVPPFSQIPTPNPAASQSQSPRDPVPKPCSRLGLSLHLHTYRDRLLFLLRPALNLSSIPGLCTWPSFVQRQGP